MSKSFLMAALLLGACGIDDTDADVEDTDVTEQASYSSWTYLSTYLWHVEVRACKTPDRIYWQFQNNTFWNVGSDGDGISYINTYIQGVPWGSKYRTRAGTAFWLNFYSAGYGVNKLYHIPDLPNC